jgi:hypothetical protein
MDAITRQVETRTAEVQQRVAGLRAERESIDQRLAEAEEELHELEIAVRVYRRFSNGSGLTLQLDPTTGPKPLDIEQRHPLLPDMSQMTLADAAATVLRAYGPGPSRDLRRVLIEAGKLPDNRNSYGYLLKILRDKPERFDKDPLGVWHLRE